MRHKFPINILMIALSSFAVGVYLSSFDVRAAFYNRPWTGLLPVFAPYLSAYVFVSFFSGKSNRTPSFLPLVGISVLGSFILSIYILTHTVIVGLQNSPVIAASDFYAPTLIAFMTSSAVFFAASASLSTIPAMIIKSRENTFR